MPSFRLMLLLPLALAAVLLPSAAHSAAKATALTVTVGPGFSIKVTDGNNNVIRQLDPGVYTFTVKNLSPSQEHNFHLTGPGVDRASAFSNTTETWDVTLGNGLYKYKCDAHPTLMKGSIQVGPPPPAPKKLSGKVGPRLTISLKTATGAAAKSLNAATYRLTVKDATKKDNFHRFGPGVNKKTGVKFRGTTSWTVRLKIGKYTYRSDAHKKLKRTVLVAPSPPTP